MLQPRCIGYGLICAVAPLQVRMGEFATVHDGIEDLKGTVAALEAVVAAHIERAAEQAERTRVLQAEVAALRSAQRAMAERLDAAIARLKTSLDD
ncbi:MAG: hypothetical protein JNM48_00245 [Rhodospirillales bacterium]|nr:hypothetical protein [Rhodospirillales bacterium]